MWIESAAIAARFVADSRHTQSNMEGPPISMQKLTRFILLLLFVTFLGGIAFLAVWDIPPPVQTVEKALPDAALTH
ncbi:MAG TPA: hypothetical protein DCO73_03565 [Alphaproteobacteria bacterium]|nr:hypothetical protein [Alphaproteobacteria bacterium]